MRIQKNNNLNFKNISKLSKPLSVFYDKNAVLPTLFIETGVTLGRTYEAKKKGGNKEAIERFVEQGISAIVWLRGIQAIKSLGKLVAKFLNIDKNKNFSSANIIGSTAAATYFIGFILPKINHFISEKLTAKKEQQTSEKILSFDEYKNKTSKKDISFKSIHGFANLLENNATAGLLITDAGVIAGRFKNGRNKYEKIEGLFRDIASIYFYLRFTDDIVKVLGKMTNTENVSPKLLEELVEKIRKEDIDRKEALKLSDSKEFKKFVNKIDEFNLNNVEELAKKTINKNFAFYSAATVLSAFSLGILIPKAQYFLRKKLTNKDQFPGDDNYNTIK